MIESQEVEQPVRGEQDELVHQSVVGGLGLRLGHLRAQHDVAEQAGSGRPVLGPRAQLVHREAEDVSGTRLVHPLHVKSLHGALVDEDDRHLGVRADVQLREVVVGQPLQHGLVDVDG